MPAPATQSSQPGSVREDSHSIVRCPPDPRIKLAAEAPGQIGTNIGMGMPWASERMGGRRVSPCKGAL